MLREGTPIGAISVGKVEAGSFSDKQIALLKTFADQAVIAIENVRLFQELQGRLAEGRALLEEAISEGIRAGIPQSLVYAQLSEVWHLAGRGEEAEQHACQALDLARQLKERSNEALALHQLGVVQAHADSPDVVQAEAYYRQALTLAEELDMRPLQAHCHRGLGTLYGRTGQRQQAHTELSTAIELYCAMDMTFWLPQAEAALAQVKA
jgi:tetratricopeptide (TPR) repeat protein